MLESNPGTAKTKLLLVKVKCGGNDPATGLPCLIFFLCIPLEKAPRSLFEVHPETEGCGEGTQICDPIHQGQSGLLFPKRL